MTIQELEPARLWHYFAEITQIPRPSTKEEAIVKYLLEFARTHSLEYKTDTAKNVVIYKAASLGYETHPITVLQCHTDMVCEKNSDKIHNFETDPIEAYVDGNWVKARGTTLGADDGIGIAAQLAVLESKSLKHGPIECLFTADEESGMTGAMGLSTDWLKGKILLNLDSEDDGQLFIGCAGGMETLAKFAIKPKPARHKHSYFRIQISGLRGGHSGDEIHKGHANAIKILSRLLRIVVVQERAVLCHIEGGNLRNAIPREAFAVVGVPTERLSKFEPLFDKFVADVLDEYRTIEPNFLITREHSDAHTVLGRKAQSLIIDALMACPHGEQRWSPTMPNLVETSTNLASVRTSKQKVVVVTSQRSSSESGLVAISQSVEALFGLAGARVIQTNPYPAWAPRIDSEILTLTARCYHDLFGQDAQVKAIHAGLECGLFLEKYPEMDMVSFGPTVRGAHSPDERVEIPTVEKFWKWLVLSLERI